MNGLAKSLDLFEGTVEAPVPETEGIKYAGSKLKLLPHILKIVRSLSVEKVFDGFSGTTRVSQAFAKEGLEVICSDISVWSEVFGTCYLQAGLQKIMANLIKCPGKSKT